MGRKIDIKYSLITVAALAILSFFMMRSCVQKRLSFLNEIPVIQKTDTARSAETSIKFDSSEKNIEPKPIRIHDSIFVPTTQNIDTAEIIRRYLTAYFYVDSCRTADLSLVVSDSLFNNRITFRNYRYKILRPDSIITITTTITNTLAPNYFYLGAGIISLGTQMGVSGKVLYTKSKFAYDVGSVISWPWPNFQFGIYYKIR